MPSDNAPRKLTNAAIDALEGVELDAAIAQDILGYWWGTSWGFIDHNGRHLLPPGMERTHYTGHEIMPAPPDAPLCPSSYYNVPRFHDGERIWDLIGRFRVQVDPPPTGGQWYAYPLGQLRHCACADTPAVAVCRAILKQHHNVGWRQDRRMNAYLALGEKPEA